MGFENRDPLKIGRQVGEDAMFHRIALCPIDIPKVIRVEDYIHGENCKCTVECGGEV